MEERRRTKRITCYEHMMILWGRDKRGVVSVINFSDVGVAFLDEGTFDPGDRLQVALPSQQVLSCYVVRVGGGVVGCASLSSQ